MLKIKDDVDLKELQKFGFVEMENGCYEYIRILENDFAYRIYTTKTHHYLQIQIGSVSLIAGKLQDLLYDLIKADLVEKV